MFSSFPRESGEPTLKMSFPGYSITQIQVVVYMSAEWPPGGSTNLEIVHPTYTVSL
jgi:hypothetical protein